MGIFGKPKDKTGLPGIISGYGGGTWNADGSQATPMNPGGVPPSLQIPGAIDTTDAQPAKKPGAFSKDGWAWKVLGTIGDAMQVGGGGHASYMPAFMDQLATEKAQQQQYAQQQQLMEAAMRMGMTPDQAMIAMQDPKALASRTAQVAMPDPIRFANKAGDQIQIGKDGKPQVLYTDTTPDIVPVQGSGVYAMDRHTGGQFGGAPAGTTPLTPEEIQQMGLHPNGPDAMPAPQQPTRPSQVISRQQAAALQSSLGAGFANYLRQHNLAIGN